MLLPCGLFSRPNYSKGSRKIKKKNTKHIVGWCWLFLYGMIKRKLSTKKKLCFYCYLNPLWWSTTVGLPPPSSSSTYYKRALISFLSACVCVCVCDANRFEYKAKKNRQQPTKVKVNNSKRKNKKNGEFFKKCFFLFFFILELLWLLAAHLSLLTTISVAVSFWRLRVCTTSSSYFFISIPENGNV